MTDFLVDDPSDRKHSSLPPCPIDGCPSQVGTNPATGKPLPWCGAHSGRGVKRRQWWQ